MNKFIISESEKQRILGMHKLASSRHYLNEDTGLKTMELKWQSCDGNLNKLSDVAVENLNVSKEEDGKKLYSFTKAPNDKSEKNPDQYDFQGCVCMADCIKETFYIENDGENNIIRSSLS